MNDKIYAGLTAQQVKDLIEYLLHSDNDNLAEIRLIFEKELVN